jgi:hypothetical protein
MAAATARGTSDACNLSQSLSRERLPYFPSGATCAPYQVPPASRGRLAGAATGSAHWWRAAGPSRCAGRRRKTACVDGAQNTAADRCLAVQLAAPFLLQPAQREMSWLSTYRLRLSLVARFPASSRTGRAADCGPGHGSAADAANGQRTGHAGEAGMVSRQPPEARRPR